MPYVRQRWQKPEATPRTRHGTRARGALASASSTAFYCARQRETTLCRDPYPRGRVAPRPPLAITWNLDGATRDPAPLRLGGLCGSAARAGRPLRTPPHARSPHGGPGAGAEPGTLRGYHRQARGAAHPRWVSRPRSSSPGASIAVIPGVPPPSPVPGPRTSHIDTYERARPARRVEPLRKQVACASYTHDREHSDGWPSYPGSPNAMPLSSTSIASSPSY